MARQLCCRGMCKNLLRSDGQQWSCDKAKFPSDLNCGQKNVSETGPKAQYMYIIINEPHGGHQARYLPFARDITFSAGALLPNGRIQINSLIRFLIRSTDEFTRHSINLLLNACHQQNLKNF